MRKFTIIYHTLDTLPLDGPGIYNRAADPSCEHPLGKQWCVWAGDVLSDKNKINRPTAVICLDCGCGVPMIGKNPPPSPSRDECETIIRRDFAERLADDRMSVLTVNRVLLYLFGARAFPRPKDYYRGRALPDRRTAKLRGLPRQTPVALRSAIEMRARGEIAAFPRSLARLNAVMPYRVHSEDGGYWLIRRELRSPWMAGAVA